MILSAMPPDLSPRVSSLVKISCRKPMPLEAPVTMAAGGSLPVAFMAFPFRLVGVRKVRSGGSEIRIKHDAVARLAGLKWREGGVDPAHWEVLGLRRDVVP